MWLAGISLPPLFKIVVRFSLFVVRGKAYPLLRCDFGVTVNGPCFGGVRISIETANNEQLTTNNEHAVI
jgi:hypothetical protein